jgi:hypothetical protein
MIPIVLLGGVVLLLALSNAKKGSAGQVLDHNLPGDVAQAVVTAIAIERKPQNLHSFSASLLPDYPKASAALAARAKQLPPA